MAPGAGGSGCARLVDPAKKLSIFTTPNQDSPVSQVGTW
jgi:hypothetical protein